MAGANHTRFIAVSKTGRRPLFLPSHASPHGSFKEFSSDLIYCHLIVRRANATALPLGCLLFTMLYIVNFLEEKNPHP